MTYATISKRAQRLAARVPRTEAQPGVPVEARRWQDVDFKTAVAQAEARGREMPGAYHRIGVRVAIRREIRAARPSDDATSG
jgi:hypothetical protein